MAAPTTSSARVGQRACRTALTMALTRDFSAGAYLG
jgi:hypothetical protein